MKSGFRQVCLMLLVFLLFSGTALAANYIVSGATDGDANGLYVENGISDGVPKYTKGDWTLQREDWMGKGWFIRNGFTMVPYSYINSPNSSDLPPNDGQWVQWDGDPVPVPDLTITLDPLSIPSLGTWGVLIMLTLLIGIAIAVIRKRRFPDTGARA